MIEQEELAEKREEGCEFSKQIYNRRAWHLGMKGKGNIFSHPQTVTHKYTHTHLYDTLFSKILNVPLRESEDMYKLVINCYHYQYYPILILNE